MACLAIVVVLALVGLVVLMMHQWRRKRLTLRWWAVPAILIVGAASFPQSVVTTLYFLIQAKVMAPYDLALWITDAWREYGRYAAFVWVVGFPLILWRKGVVFEARRDAVRSAAVAILIMLPLTVFDSSLFWAANRAEKTDRISSISPDGLLRVTATAVVVENYAMHLEMVSEENASHPLVARRLASVGDIYWHWQAPILGLNAGTDFWDKGPLSRLFPEPDPYNSRPFDGCRIVWSSDSRVVYLLGGPDPPYASCVTYYDFSRNEGWTVSPGEIPPVLLYGDNLNKILVEHGGLAPQVGTTEP
jgi:hypothetical protein